jgi:mRNA interferase RelE/StbE
LSFEVRLSKRANRELSSLQSSIRDRIIARLEELRDDPFPHGVMKLQGRKNLYRTRVGDYRILYEVLTKAKLVLVDKIDHRGNVYGP